MASDFTASDLMEVSFEPEGLVSIEDKLTADPDEVSVVQELLTDPDNPMSVDPTEPMVSLEATNVPASLEDPNVPESLEDPVFPSSVEDLEKELSLVREEYVRLQDHLADIELKYQSALTNEKEGTDSQFSFELLNVVANLFNCEKYSDVQVLLEHGRIFFGHKLILAARSNYWGVTDLSLAPSVDFKHVNYDVSMAVLQWIYTDEIDIENVSVDFLMELLQVSSKYHLETLFTRSQKTLITRITEENCQKLYRLANELPSTTLKNHCLEYMTRGKDGVVIVTDDLSGNNPLKTSSTDQLDCDVCNKSFTTQPKLKRHLLTHAGEKPFKCPICGKGMMEKTTLKKHLRTQHPKADIEDSDLEQKKYKKQPFQCETCLKVLSCYQKYQRHKLVHSKEKPFKCTECNKGLADNSSLMYHKRIYHSQDSTKEVPTDYSCELCDYKTPRKYDFRRHIKKIHPDVADGLLSEKKSSSEQQRVTCNICNHVCGNKRKLETHMRIHTGEKPFSCDRCGQNFRRQDSFKYHLLTHGDKKHQCEICGKKFYLVDQLKRHNRIHNGSTPYSCDECGQAFRHYNSLTVHKRMQHSGHRPYICDVCGRSYVLMSHLKAHQETHTGGKRRECDLCKTSYASANGLRRHKAKVHNVAKKTKTEYSEPVSQEIIIELPVEQVEFFKV